METPESARSVVQVRDDFGVGLGVVVAVEMERSDKIKEAFWRKNREATARAVLLDVRARRPPRMAPRLLAHHEGLCVGEKTWVN